MEQVNNRHPSASRRTKTLWKGKRSEREGRRLLRSGQPTAEREPELYGWELVKTPPKCGDGSG